MGSASSGASSAQAELPLVQEHPLIRAANVYAELFARCAAQSLSTTSTPTTQEFPA